MNCTVVFFRSNVGYQTSQTVILSLMLFGILIINFLTLGLSIYIKVKCPFRKLFMSSYIGNIIGGSSFFLNEIKYTKDGILPHGCHVGLDRYFFFYLGVSINMIILLTNSYIRYKAIASMHVSRGNTNLGSNRYIFTHYSVPAWILSICIATVVTVIQEYVFMYPYLNSFCISVIPLTISIVCNVMLNRFLTSSRGNSQIVRRSESTKHLDGAKSLIQATITAHSIYITLGFAAAIISHVFSDNKTVFVTCLWLFWLVNTAMFSIEAKIFLHKTAAARRAICLRKNFRMSSAGSMGTSNSKI